MLLNLLFTLTLLLPLQLQFTTSSIAYIATEEAILHSKQPFLLSDDTNTLTFNSLANNEIFARPQSATKTGIPYSITSHVVDDPKLIVCFVVQHLTITKRTCSEEGTNGKGMLIIERLGSPTITAVLLRKGLDSSVGGSMLLAWSTFEITVVTEIEGRDFQRSHIWKKQMQHINMQMKPKGTWFNTIVVLNLPIRKQLMEDLIVHLHERVPTSMNIVRHEAIDGKLIDVEAIELSKAAKDSIVHDTTSTVEAITMTRGALGCALSHIALWEHVVATNETMMIIEDDVRLSPLFAKVMKEIEVPMVYDVIYLSFPDFGRRTDLSGEGGYGVERVLGDNWGTSGYVVSVAGAKKLLKGVYPIEFQIDKYLVDMVEKGWLEGEEGEGGIVAYVVEPILVREWKSLHVSDIQRE